LADSAAQAEQTKTVVGRAMASEDSRPGTGRVRPRFAPRLAGQTNHAIAEALFVTTKTVEQHLRNAYRKLGVSSRRDLADRLADR
jgi:FixJ family two-component response regulator